MIKSITIENFKSIKKLEIELAPLTIFVGPNGSGKSSILEAIALMSQATQRETSLTEGRKGHLVNFEERKNLFCKENEDEPIILGFGVGLNIKESERLKDSISSDLKREVFIKLGAAFVDKVLKKPREEDLKTASYYTKVLKKGWYHQYSINQTVIAKHMQVENRTREFPDKLIATSPSRFLTPIHFEKSGKPSFLMEILFTILSKTIENVYYLAPERANIGWEYRAITGGHQAPQWVGRHGRDTIAILSKLMDPENIEKRLPYELFYGLFGIKNPWAGWQMENILRSNYQDPLLGSSHKLLSLGYGSRQLLSVITQLAYSKKGDHILIEEPETSLHPNYQAKLPLLFGFAVNQGKQILATTHSSYFPLAISSVLEGDSIEGQTTRGMRKFDIKLDIDDVVIYHVTRDKDYTEAKKLEIDEMGLKEGIPSFIDVEKELLKRFIVEEEGI